MKLFVTLLLVTSLFGCSFNVGKNNNSIHISQAEATDIARRYMSENNLIWGEPTSIRESHKHYIFMYFTPDSESRKIGGRILNVDKVSGIILILPRL